MTAYSFLPTRSIFGEGASQEVGQVAASLGATTILIVTDAFLASCGMAAKIQEIFHAAGLKAYIFDGVAPNPTTENVEDGKKVFQKHHCDGLVSLGGGSAHDCAKAIGVVVANGGEIVDYEGTDKTTAAMVPLIAITTTAGTASEVTRICMLTDTTRKEKIAIVDWRITPHVAIIDPALMVGMPPSLTAATGMDALTHAVEAYVSTIANPLSDSAALSAISLIAKYLPRAVANGADLEAREKMSYGQYLAGVAFGSASLGYVHAMAHQLGGLYNLPHGVCNAVLLPYVEAFNMIGCLDRFCGIAKALGESVDGMSPYDAAGKAVHAMYQLGQITGIPASLKELGVNPEDFAMMAKNAEKDVCQLTNPRIATQKQIIKIFEKAYGGLSPV